MSSVRLQSLEQWRAWVVDDGSEPSHAQGVGQALLALGDERIRYVPLAHRGPAAARNAAIAMGSAPLVAMLDSDDLWMPAHLSGMRAILAADEGLAMAHGNHDVIDEHGRLVCSPLPPKGLNDLTPSQGFVRMLHGNFVAHSSAVVRRSALEELGGFDESFLVLEDKVLWMHLLSRGMKCHFDPEVVTRCRLHSGNVSKRTELFFAARLRISELAESLIRANAHLREIDWPKLGKEMRHHRYREATQPYLNRGRCARALEFGSPIHTGFSRESCILFLLHSLLARSCAACARCPGRHRTGGAGARRPMSGESALEAEARRSRSRSRWR